MIPEFSCKRKGYDRREVNMYITKIHGEYENIVNVCKQFQDKTHEREIHLPEQEDIARVMLLAQAFSRKTEQEAQERAHRIISEAQSRAGKIIDEAQTIAGRITKQAEEERDSFQFQLNEVYTMLSAPAEGEDARGEGIGFQTQNNGRDRQGIYEVLPLPQPQPSA